MIVGIGIDTVSIARLEKLIHARGERFLRKIFSAREMAEGMKRTRNAPYFAARFAAREAFVKALGTGFAGGISLHDISVGTHGGGRPEMLYSERMEKLLGSRGIERCHLSITHDGDSAQAIVILEGSPGAAGKESK
jgi:holo-[acyl-carrier protein] synthase